MALTRDTGFHLGYLTVNRVAIRVSNNGAVLRLPNGTGNDGDDGGGMSDDHWTYSMRSRNRNKDSGERTAAGSIHRDSN